MRLNHFPKFFFGFLTLAVVASGAIETSTTDTTTTGAAGVTEEVVAASSTGVFGSLDFRPEYQFREDAHDGLSSDNTVALGYQINPELSLKFTQYFRVNFSDFDNPAEVDEFVLSDSHISAGLPAIGQTGNTTITFEPRLYLPTSKDKADAGFITALRTNFVFTNQATERLAIEAAMIPLLHVYSKPGIDDAKGAKANPLLEGRVEATAKYSITDKLVLNFPAIKLYNTLNRTYGDASNSARVTFFLYMWPEITYAVSDNFTLGVAYVTGNMVNDDLGDFSLGRAFGNGNAQLILSATL